MAAATALLTILPVPERWQQEAAWPRAMRALPLVGAFVGLASGLLGWLTLLAGASVTIAAILSVLAGIVLTGALHEDGLADVADALGGGTRARRLEILHDAHAGTFAVLALVLVIALQAAALASLFSGDAAMATVALVATHALSRSAVVALARWLPPAREDGLGHSVARPGVAGIAMGIVPAFLLPLYCGGAITALAGALGATALAGAISTWLAGRLFGGQTGDVLGASETIVRTSVLIVLAATCPVLKQ